MFVRSLITSDSIDPVDFGELAATALTAGVFSPYPTGLQLKTTSAGDSSKRDNSNKVSHAFYIHSCS